MTLDSEIHAGMIELGLSPAQIAAVFRLFDRRRHADANARNRRKPDRKPDTRAERATRFSADAIPEPDRTKYAIENGIEPARVADVFAMFANHFTANGKPYVSWPAAWRNWVLRETRMTRLNPDRADGRPVARTEYQFRQQEAQRVRQNLADYIARNTAATPSSDTSD